MPPNFVAERVKRYKVIYCLFRIIDNHRRKSRIKAVAEANTQQGIHHSKTVGAKTKSKNSQDRNQGLTVL